MRLLLAGVTPPDASVIPTERTVSLGEKASIEAGGRAGATPVANASLPVWWKWLVGARSASWLGGEPEPRLGDERVSAAAGRQPPGTRPYHLPEPGDSVNASYVAAVSGAEV